MLKSLKKNLCLLIVFALTLSGLSFGSPVKVKADAAKHSLEELKDAFGTERMTIEAGGTNYVWHYEIGLWIDDDDWITNPWSVANDAVTLDNTKSVCSIRQSSVDAEKEELKESLTPTGYFPENPAWTIGVIIYCGAEWACLKPMNSDGSVTIVAADIDALQKAKFNACFDDTTSLSLSLKLTDDSGTQDPSGDGGSVVPTVKHSMEDFVKNVSNDAHSNDSTLIYHADASPRYYYWYFSDYGLSKDSEFGTYYNRGQEEIVTISLQDQGETTNSGVNNTVGTTASIVCNSTGLTLNAYTTENANAFKITETTSGPNGRVHTYTMEPADRFKNDITGTYSFSITDTDPEASLSQLYIGGTMTLHPTDGDVSMFLYAGMDMSSESYNYYSNNDKNYSTDVPSAPAMTVKDATGGNHEIKWQVLGYGSDGIVDTRLSTDDFVVNAGEFGYTANGNTGIITANKSGSVTLTPSLAGFIKGLRGSAMISWTVDTSNDGNNDNNDNNDNNNNNDNNDNGGYYGGIEIPAEPKEEVKEEPKKPTNEVEKVKTEVKEDVTVIKELKIDEETKKTEDKELVIKTDDKNGKKGVELTKEHTKEIVKVLKDDTNKKEELSVQMDKFKVSFDTKALESAHDQSKGDTLRIVAEDKQEGFTNEQKKTFEEKEPVLKFEVYVESNGERLHEYNGGEISVSFDAGESVKNKDPRHLFVEYVAEDGTTQRMDTRITDDNHLQFRTKHTSDYIVVYDENDINGYDDVFTAVLEMRKVIRKGRKFNIVLSSIDELTTFTTSDSKIATVSDKGVITAKNEGTAYIDVTSGSYRARIKVVVQNAEGMQLATKTDDAIMEDVNGAVITVMKKVKKGRNTRVVFSNAEDAVITYKTSNDSVAVSKNGRIKRVKDGKCYIDITVEQYGTAHVYRIVAE